MLPLMLNMYVMRLGGAARRSAAHRQRNRRTTSAMSNVR